MADEMTIKDGFLYGPWRKGVNAAATMSTSIHDDAVGKSVGMRGGVVAGTVHLDLFVPIAVKLFGQKWFETGSVSMFYLYAILGGEELRVIAQMPPKNARDVQVAARVETPDGKKVMEGTLSIGNPKEKSHLRELEKTLKDGPQEELRILKGVRAGDVLKSRAGVHTMTKDDMKNARRGSEEWNDWYEGETPWGGAIVPPGRLAGMMHVFPETPFRGVAFYGATEIRFFHGPAMVGQGYDVTGKAVCVGQGGRTEYLWTDSDLKRKDGTLVARMLHLHRIMKKGSPLYPEEK